MRKDNYMIYEPKEDSLLLAKYVAKFARGKVLDMGTGSGIQAETALKFTKDILAIDINRDAIKYVKKKGVKAKISDLFSDINEKFDLIIFNPPYLPNEELEDKETSRIISGGKYGYETLERFFSQINKYLNEYGKTLIIFSSLTNKNNVDNIIKENKFKFKLLESKKVLFETLYCYLVEKA